MATRIQFRRGSASEWASSNPVLAHGEIALELDTDRIKVGNGVDAWNDRPYTDKHAVQQLQNHINSAEPHSAYDDMPSLNLIFENGLI